MGRGGAGSPEKENSLRLEILHWDLKEEFEGTCIRLCKPVMALRPIVLTLTRMALENVCEVFTRTFDQPLITCAILRVFTEAYEAIILFFCEILLLNCVHSDLTFTRVDSRFDQCPEWLCFRLHCEGGGDSILISQRCIAVRRILLD